jgi:integrase
MNKVILDFLNELRANRKAEITVQNNANILTKLNNFKPVEKMTKEDLKAFFSSLKLSENNYRAHQIVIRRFFNKIGKPDIIEWMEIIKPKETLRSDEILNTDEINKMIDGTEFLYYKAFIAFLWESGCRFSEAHRLKWKDFIETDSGLITHIETRKTGIGYRKIILPFAAQYIRNLKAHVDAQPDNVVFHVGNTQSNDMMQIIAGKAGIKKPISCHKMRHGQATNMVQMGYNEAIIRKKLGWSPTSAMIARYVHLDDTDVIRASLEKAGKLPAEQIPLTELKEPDKITLIDAAMQFSKLTEENSELKTRLDEVEDQHKAQMDKQKVEMAAMKRQMEFITAAMQAKKE